MSLRNAVIWMDFPSGSRELWLAPVELHVFNCLWRRSCLLMSAVSCCNESLLYTSCRPDQSCSRQTGTGTGTGTWFCTSDRPSCDSVVSELCLNKKPLSVDCHWQPFRLTKIWNSSESESHISATSIGWTYVPSFCQQLPLSLDCLMIDILAVSNSLNNIRMADGHFILRNITPTCFCLWQELECDSIGSALERPIIESEVLVASKDNRDWKLVAVFVLLQFLVCIFFMRYK